jgi:nitrate reductase gamma subunit/ferredoxin
VGVDYVRDYLPFLPHTATLVAMYACVAVMAGLFVWGAVRRYGRYRGAGGSLWAGVSGGALSGEPRLRRAVVDVVAQSKVRERRLPAALHLPLFYGMVLLFVGTAIVGVYEDVLRWFGDFTLQGTFYVLFEGVLDAAGLALVVGVCIALWRRLVMRPEYLVRRATTTVILCGLVFMGLSGFGLEAFRIAAHPNDWAGVAFVGWSLSHLLSSFASDSGSAVIAYRVLWWTHAAAAFSLIVGLAWTGLSHVLVLPASVAAHDPARPRTRLTTPFNLIEAMESEEDVELIAGTAGTAAIAAPQRLAADACMGCGRCHAECPAQTAGRPLSPRDLLQDLRRSLGAGRRPARHRLRGGCVVVHQLLRLRAGVPGADPSRRLRSRLPPRPRRREPPGRTEGRRAAGARPQLEPVSPAVAPARRLAHGAPLRGRDHVWCGGAP